MKVIFSAILLSEGWTNPLSHSITKDPLPPMTLSSSGTSRRTLAKGAAWAAPVLLASTAIPAYAASMCESYRSNFNSGFSLQNPVSGSLWVPGSNRVYNGNDGVPYFYAGTSGGNPEGALIRHTGLISSGDPSNSNLKTGCSYRVSYDISSIASITGADLHPIMTIYMVSPSGAEVAGSRVSYSGTAGVATVQVPVGARSGGIRKQATGRGFSFTAEAGTYRWVAEIWIPHAPNAGRTASGLGYSAPVFTAG